VEANHNDFRVIITVRDIRCVELSFSVVPNLNPPTDWSSYYAGNDSGMFCFLRWHAVLQPRIGYIKGVEINMKFSDPITNQVKGVAFFTPYLIFSTSK